MIDCDMMITASMYDWLEFN